MCYFAAFSLCCVSEGCSWQNSGFDTKSEISQKITVSVSQAHNQTPLCRNIPKIKVTVRWRISLSLSSFFLIHTKQTTINIVWSNQILGFPHNCHNHAVTADKMNPQTSFWLLLLSACIVLNSGSSSGGSGVVGVQARSPSSPVTKVVVLMMENRSFDHLLGWSAFNRSDINGLTGRTRFASVVRCSFPLYSCVPAAMCRLCVPMPALFVLTSLCRSPCVVAFAGKEYNLMNPADPTSERVYVNQRGRNVAPSDPQHDFVSTTQQIYGNSSGHTGELETMSGFVANSYENDLNYTTPMSMFTEHEDSAPIINLLAREFITFDAWYPSLPGPTDPNRAFVMSGTSNGMLENYNGTQWSQQSFFDFLTQHNRTWGAYYDDDPWAFVYFEDIGQPANKPHVKQIESFFSEVESGHLNEFTFLQPRMHNHMKCVGGVCFRCSVCL
jgi:Phosphoesterase family